ncbi:ATP-binding cassette domain-containing protein [Lysobacter yangpyeongensis]|uniref:ATP-binding cassette domain-containing protein n=1 Tax=Lysobacter yangpyeongensis TaxID=346182 RepID=A0ABW0SKC0_9GAMM
MADIVLHPIEPYLHGAGGSVADSPELGCEAVSFRYGEQYPLVLRNCTFAISPGDSVAIVGRSGSGKSTLVNILAGSANPTTGRVTIGGLDRAHMQG